MERHRSICRAGYRARGGATNHGLPAAFVLTQQQLADTLKIDQAAISKMESQSDMYLSTLRRVLEAMGARLKIVAEFPGGDEVVIDQFAE